MRNLVLILGDQLSLRISALDGFDPEQDLVWMAEVDEEATKVWCHKTRLVFFLSAMRHFRQELQKRQFKIDYHQLARRKGEDAGPDFRTVLEKSIRQHQPKKVIVTEPGDWFVRDALEASCQQAGLDLEIRRDKHFYCAVEEFRSWAEGKKVLVLENFYRWLRRQHRILLTKSGEPIGGEWNFDKQNRKSFGKSGPPAVEPVRRFEPDSITREVMDLVTTRFATHPGSCREFAYPVTSSQAQDSLEDFIRNRLPNFGDYQDAMWAGTDFLHHSRLSVVLNVHLLDPFEVVHAAIDAFESGHVPINSVEGFVRQVIGWREFVRGIYWTMMPEYMERNFLECEDRDVPQAFWDGETDMNCVREAMRPVLEYAYAHHIQRLMVLGLFAQLLGVHPRKFHNWHMAMYADAIDWVSLPNTLGMSQHADGAVVGTKPYCASGNYIDRMSNYCKTCRFNPKLAVGDQACPITTLYWNFLARHRERFRENGRMQFQIKNLDNKTESELQAILAQAQQVLKSN